MSGRRRPVGGGLRIAMIGQRGVPATYGGVERHVEELGARLVGMGHEVVVYCRPSYSPDALRTHRGMTLAYLPTPTTKHLEAITHSAVATLAALHSGVDVIHYHALGPGLVAPLPRAVSHARIVQTVHGLDHERAKWGQAASAVLGFGAWTSAHVPDATVVVSRALQEHYRTRYGRATHYLANGVDRVDPADPAGPVDRVDREGPASAARADSADSADSGTVHRLGLTPGRYVLFVGRLVPEKEPHTLIRAFAGLPCDDVKLVIAGGSSFTDRYEDELRRLAATDPRVVLPGNLDTAAVHELYAGAAVFVQPSTMEGMPLTLLEAAAHGVPILASDIPPHCELLGASRPGVRLFRRRDEQGLRAALHGMLAEPHFERAGAAALTRWVHEHYSWDASALALARLYEQLSARPTRRSSPPPVRAVEPVGTPVSGLRTGR